MIPVEEHAFNAAVKSSFAEASAICDERAGQYGDSWAVDNMRGGYLEATLALPQPARLRLEFIRLARCATMIDLKDQRPIGKQDTLLDKLNYEAAYAQWRAEYELALRPADH